METEEQNNLIPGNNTYTGFERLTVQSPHSPIVNYIPTRSEFNLQIQYYDALKRYIETHNNTSEIGISSDGQITIIRSNPGVPFFVEIVENPYINIITDRRVTQNIDTQPTRREAVRPRRMNSVVTAVNKYRAFLDYGISASPDSALRKAKNKYLHEISYADAKKAHPFISQDIRLGAISHTYYTKKQFGDGASFIFDNDGKANIFDDSISFEIFRDKARLCYLKGDEIDNGSYYNKDGEKGLAMELNRSQYPMVPIRFTVASGTVEGYCKGRSSGKNNVICYFKPRTPIKFVIITYHPGCDIEGHEIMLSHDEPLKQDGNMIDNIQAAYKKARYIVSKQLDEFIQNNEVSNRKPKVWSSKHRSDKKGLYISHNIPFSCEIECYGKDKRAVAQFSHRCSRQIGMCHDGSLTSPIGFPIELQTPILKGKRGEILIANLCTDLIGSGFKVDKSCGLHIHLDGSEFNLNTIEMIKGLTRPTNVIALYLAYRLFDPVIVSLLPSTRRANRYCSSFNDGAIHNNQSIHVDPISVSAMKMRKIKTIKEFENYWYKTGGDYERVLRAKGSRYTVSRYFGVNFHSLLAQNHLEIRYHSGTLNYEKIMYWIEFHGKIIEKVLSRALSIESIEVLIGRELSLEKLTDAMFNILELNDDVVEYLKERQTKFKDVVASEEILINKTKKVDNE